MKIERLLLWREISNGCVSEFLLTVALISLEIDGQNDCTGKYCDEK